MSRTRSLGYVLAVYQGSSMQFALRKSHYLVSVPLSDSTSGPDRVLLFSTRTSAIRELDASAWAAAGIAPHPLLDEDMVNDLAGAKMLVPATENELAAVIGENNAAARESDELYYVVQPTAACQLGCDYCGQEHTAKVLSEEDQDLIIARLDAKLSRSNFRTLKIGWFGAEPLLGLNAMRRLSPRLATVSEQHGCRYVSEIVTNGLLLTPEIAQELENVHRVRYVEVTLDGIAVHHDARRKWKGHGRPSFDAIYENLAKLLRSKTAMKVGLRCNVDRRNYDGISPLLRQLVGDGLQGNLFGVYMAPIHSWGNDADAQSADPATFASWEIGWLVEMHNLGFSVRLLPERRAVTCMTLQPQAELVDAYGNLFDCTEVSYVPTYDQRAGAGKMSLPIIGQERSNSYAIGHVEDRDPSPTRTHLAAFNDRVLEGAYPCSTCEMLPVCGGHCPKLWHEGKVNCPSPKHNIRERMLVYRALSLGLNVALS